MPTLNLKVPAAYKAHLRLGTCSWKYEGWKGLVYRAGIEYAAGDYLADYAKHFNTVEVDQWFWGLFPAGVRLPDPAVAKSYAESVPDDFLFTVKAPNGITLTHLYAAVCRSRARTRPQRHLEERKTVGNGLERRQLACTMLPAVDGRHRRDG
jgi:uncharacterized protein YecE (DUF72 family)